MKQHLLAGAALFLAVPATAQNLVANGGFETGDFTGFDQFGVTDFDVVGVDPDAASTGTFGAFFGPEGAIGGIRQNLATVAGQSYLISFDLSNRGLEGETPNFHDVDFGAVQLFSASDTPAFAFQRFSATALATGATTTLSFAFRHDPDFFLLDNISVTAVDVAAAIPEPATWAMMLVGFAAAGVAVRRGRKAGGERAAA